MSSDDYNSSFPPVVHPFCDAIQETLTSRTDHCTADPPAESRTGEFSDTSSNHPDLVDADAARDLYPRLSQEQVCPPDDKDRPRILTPAAFRWKSRPPSADPGESRNIRDLMGKVFPPVQWLIPGMLPPGLCFLAAPPKHGKSYLALDIALAVARGGAALGGLPCQFGGAFYIALEDSEERLQRRVNEIYPDNVELPIAFDYQLKCWTMPRFPDFLTQHCAIHRETKLVVVDTYGRISEDKGIRGGYKSDYQETACLQELAIRLGICLFLIHHLRKGVSADPFEDISGTYGVTGAADTLWVLRTDPETQNANLHIRGRDVEHQSHSLQWSGERWLYQGKTSLVKHSEEEQEIIDLLTGEPYGKTIRQMCQSARATKEALRKRLEKMHRKGIVEIGEGYHWKLKNL